MRSRVTPAHRRVCKMECLNARPYFTCCSNECAAQLPGVTGPAFVGRESLLRKDTKGYEVEDLHVPFLDCPC
jgi:hypothetical protein